MLIYLGIGVRNAVWSAACFVITNQSGCALNCICQMRTYFLVGWRNVSIRNARRKCSGFPDYRRHRGDSDAHRKQRPGHSISTVADGRDLRWTNHILVVQPADV